MTGEYDDKKFGTKAQEKVLFSVTQLADLYGFSRQTVAKMLAESPPATKRYRANVWHLKGISNLIDFRVPFDIPANDKDDIIELNPDKMHAAERRLHYQAEDLKQSANIKLRRNQVESRVLIPAVEVEAALSTGFKAVALILDTLPDTLERDGVIESSDVDRVIKLVDSTRDQLAATLGDLSNKTELANVKGDW